MDLLQNITKSGSSSPDEFGVELSLEQNGSLVPIETILGMGQVMHFVDSVKVNIKLGQILNIEVGLNPPLDQALKLLRSGTLGLGFTVKKTGAAPADPLAGIAAPSGGSSSVFVNKMAVRLHYAGLKSKWFKGLLLQPDIEINAEGISITMKAIGMLFESSKTYVAKSYTGKENTSTILNEILGKQFQIIYKPEAKSQLGQPYGKPINSTKSNMELAKDIIQEKNCFMYESGSSDKKQQKIVISTVNEMRQKPKAKASLVAYRQINPANREFPLISFSAPIQNLLLPGAPWGGVKAQQFSSDKKSLKPTNVPKETYSKDRSNKINSSDGTMGGSVSQGQITGSGDAGGISRNEQAGRTIPIPSRDAKHNALDMMKGFVHDFTDTVFKYDVTTIGIVDLLPGNMIHVAISNIKELTGLFDCTEIEHVISNSGCETRLSLVRTGGLVTAASQGAQKAINKGVDALSGQTKTSLPIG